MPRRLRPAQQPQICACGLEDAGGAYTSADAYQACLVQTSMHRHVSSPKIKFFCNFRVKASVSDSCCRLRLKRFLLLGTLDSPGLMRQNASCNTMLRKIEPGRTLMMSDCSRLPQQGSATLARLPCTSTAADPEEGHAACAHTSLPSAKMGRPI